METKKQGESMIITIWQNGTEKIVQHTEKGKHKTFVSANDLIDFLQEYAKSKVIKIKVEQV